MSKKQPIPFGKYLLLDRVNIGGMAEVWKGKSFGAEGFEKLVAIKRILPNIAEDEEFIAMFIDEAKISVQLTHANIAQVFDLGKIGESYYIAMEYVSGKDLRAMFDKARKRGEPAPIPLTAYCMAKAAEGLDFAHRKRDATGLDLNIVHRDVSPQNILCSFDGEVKVIDFGIAKAANKATKTQAGILKGKFGYMSPEQVRGLPLDRRSDVFAIGVVLYEMLTGERLFVGESDFSVLEKVRAVDILPPSTYNRRIPAALEKIVLRSLAKDVEDRFQYASEIGDELQRFLITNDTIFSRKDLMQFMKSTFAEDLEREKMKLAEYAEVKLPPGMAAAASGQVPVMSQVPRAIEPEQGAEVLAEASGPTGVRFLQGNTRTTGIRPSPPNTGVGRPGAPSASAPRPSFPMKNTGLQPALKTGTGVQPLRPPPGLKPAAPPSNAPSPMADLSDEHEEATQIPGRPKSAIRPAAVVKDDDDDDEVPKKSKVPLLLGVAGGVLALGLVGLVAFFSMGQASGTLLLNCTPSENLSILLDGETAGTATPLMRQKLAAGEHTLSVSAHGYQILRKTLTIEKQQTHNEELTLVKQEDDSAKPVAQAVIVLETPGAQVSLDGKVVIAAGAKDTIFSGAADGAQRHLVEAKLDGFKPFAQSFEAGQAIQVKVVLEKSP